MCKLICHDWAAIRPAQSVYQNYVKWVALRIPKMGLGPTIRKGHVN